MPRKTRKPVVMFLLQNQWFKDPVRTQQVLALYKDHKGEEAGWNRFVRDMLFLGCLTGRRIKDAFGEDLCWDAVVGEHPVTTVFEETSREIGDHPSAVFPPDPEHLVASLRRHRPGLIVAFGRVASTALVLPQVKYELETWPETVDIVHTGHPAARGPRVLTGLDEAAAITRNWIAEHIGAA